MVSRPFSQAAGRILTDDLNISLKYNVALNPNPEIRRATINCHNSLVLQENHARDMVLQNELAELADARERSARYTELADWTENEIVKSQRFGLPYTPLYSNTQNYPPFSLPHATVCSQACSPAPATTSSLAADAPTGLRGRVPGTSQASYTGSVHLESPGRGHEVRQAHY